MECQYCKHSFVSQISLSAHQKTAKYCLALQNVDIPDDHICEGCGKKFTRSYHLERHQKTCNVNEKLYTLEEQLEIQTKENRENKLKLQEKDNYIQKLEFTIKDLQDRLENITLQAIKRSWETVIEIEESKTPNELTDEPYVLVPLALNNEYTIEHRQEDGYIDVTNICKAGNKKFNDWDTLHKTKEFIKQLSSSAGIHADELIKQNTAGNGERHMWVHPQVAINIAQWISPQFDVKVSAWVFEVMMTGKVDITNTKSYRELKQDNTNKQLKIQLMTKKYVKKQPRTQYEEENVIYILTTSNMKKERRYILGKATNLTSRLSVYNKSDEHEVVYYQECPDEERMSIVECLVFCKLNEYREQANRERFLLPEGTSIDLFSDTIKHCIEFVKIKVNDGFI